MLTALITIDICVTFFVARFVEGELITDLRQLAKNYLKLYFWIDVFSVIPFETIAAVIAGYTYGPSDVTSQYLNLLKLTYMVCCDACHIMEAPRFYTVHMQCTYAVYINSALPHDIEYVM